VAAFLGLLFDGVELGLMPVASLSVSKSLLGDAFTPAAGGDWFARFTAALMLGAAIGGIVLGNLGDRIGRSRAMGISILFYSVCAALGSLVTSQEQMLALRFLVGLGVGGMWPNGIALVAESWPSASKATVSGVMAAGHRRRHDGRLVDPQRLRQHRLRRLEGFGVRTQGRYGERLLIVAFTRRKNAWGRKRACMRALISTSWSLAIAAVVASAGCGPATSTVSGTVTFNGEAVAKGVISLFPADGKAAPVGGMIEGGRYVITNVAPGEKIVQLSAPIVAGTRKDDYGNVTQVAEELLPASWGRASQEKITVTAGSMTKNFEITGPDPRKVK